MELSKIHKLKLKRNILKRRERGRHLPDSSLYTSAERKESTKNRQKTGAFSQHYDFHKLYI